MSEKRGVMGIRRPYGRPQMEQVQLVAEEAVLQGCKNSGTGGKNDSPCKQPACKASPES